MAISNQVLAIDVGFRQVKSVSLKRERVFPAVIAAESGWTDLDTFASISKQSPLIVDGKAYWTGTDAIYQPSATTSAQNLRMATDLAKVLVAAAIWESGLEGDIRLSTGLPLDLFRVEKEMTIEAWKGKKMVIEKNGVQRNVRIVKVPLLPQGIAALLYALSVGTIAKQWPSSGLVTLIDIGERSTDVATVRADTLEPIRGLCFSIEKAVRDLKQDVLRIARNKLPLLPDFLAEDILRHGTATYQRQTHDFSKVLLDCKEKFAQQLVGELQGKFAASDSLISLAMLAGGGAELLGKEIGHIYPSKAVPKPPMGNVLGYYQHAVTQEK